MASRELNRVMADDLSRAILAGSPSAAVIEADLREPQRILLNDTVRRLIDFGQPAAVLLNLVVHFIDDAEDPWQIVATLRDALVPGSYLVLGHGTNESKP
jgi:S-adenosyl methyltransferase